MSKKKDIHIIQTFWSGGRNSLNKVIAEAKKGFFLLAVSIVSVLLFASCDFEPTDVTFYVWEEEEWTDGRHVMCHCDDSLATFGLPDSTGCFPCTRHNLFCREKSKLLSDTVPKEKEMRKRHSLYFVHRASGRTDTLYDTFFKNSSSSIMGLGYVSGWKINGEWLVLECKLPGKIVGREDMCNVKPLEESGPLYVDMRDCTYDGQEKVFESDIVDYWIASQHTLDLYGPLTKDELKVYMTKLGIPRPMKLYAGYDRYTYVGDGVGDSFPEPEPKAFRWPHHRDREGTVIE